MEVLTLDLVRAKLQARVGGGINVDKVHINGVNTLENKLVIYSKTLPAAFFEALQEGQVPRFGGDHQGIFTEGHTFDDQYRLKGLSFDEINSMGEAIAKTFLAEAVN